MEGKTAPPKYQLFSPYIRTAWIVTLLHQNACKSTVQWWKTSGPGSKEAPDHCTQTPTGHPPQLFPSSYSFQKWWSDKCSKNSSGLFYKISAHYWSKSCDFKPLRLFSNPNTSDPPKRRPFHHRNRHRRWYEHGQWPTFDRTGYYRCPNWPRPRPINENWRGDWYKHIKKQPQWANFHINAKHQSCALTDTRCLM